VKLSTLIKITIGCGLTAGGLYIFFKEVNPAALVQEIQRIPLSSIVGTALLTLVTIFTRALRWKAMLPEKKGATIHRLFSHTIIGFMLNNILPARAGEAGRAFLLWKKNHYPVTICIGSLVVERILDLCTIFTLFSAATFFIDEPGVAAIRDLTLFMVGGVMGIVLLALLWIFSPQLFTTIGNWVTSHSPRKIAAFLNTTGHEIGATLDWLHSPKRILTIFILSFTTWACYPLMVLLLYHGPGTFGFAKATFAQTFAAFGAAIPLAPGYVGTLHAVMLKGLTMIGVASSEGQAIVILYHAIGYITITATGLLYFFSNNIQIKDFTHAQDELGKAEHNESSKNG